MEKLREGKKRDYKDENSKHDSERCTEDERSDSY